VMHGITPLNSGYRYPSRVLSFVVVVVVVDAECCFDSIANQHCCGLATAIFSTHLCSYARNTHTHTHTHTHNTRSFC
jgi:hypothetical protein